MARPRFALIQLMAAVVIISVGLVALRSASLLWASALFTFTVLILSAAVLGAMARRGRSRMTWAGFALFGWVYFGTTFGPWGHPNGVLPPPYLTRLPLDYWDAQHWLLPGRIDTGEVGEMLFPRLSPPRPWPSNVVPGITSPDSHHFRRIGHCLIALVAGMVGAVVGRLVVTTH